MVTAARDRLARTLRGDAEAVFSVQFTARMDDLSLAVEGFGPVRFPVTPAKARKLADLGQPARFGRGEQTVTDPDVRDTWEIPKHLVRAEWNGAALEDILATVKEGLGLPSAAELAADLHSLLVYEPNQFFLAHQDSEKDDSMIGTLVVTLPSSYTGGELMVGLGEEWKSYRGSKTALSLVAFYADCRHEVLRVVSGYRITLTYNLLLQGDTNRPAGEEGAVAELADLLREHFHTPAPRYYGGPAGDPPNRLVYLLDHEYTARGLSWQRLKGADAGRAALLRSAAGKAGCEALLALADIKTTHSAFEADEGYEYRDWYGDDGEDEDEDPGDEGEGEYEVQELVDSEVTITHWTGPDGTRLEETALYVPGNEVCASTPTGDLAPYSSQYEGYMGNWGNTLDRWYHRAAVIVWPGDQAFANRAGPSPSYRHQQLTDLGKPLAAVLTAAAAIEATSTRDTACQYVREQGDAVTALEMAALHAAKRPRGRTRPDAGFRDLAADCAGRLRVRLARPQRAPGDWSIALPAGGCTCELCATLRVFLSDASRRTFEWPLAKQRRQHVHARIDTAELPVSHLTRRQGRPYTLVLSKTDALFTQEQDARTRDKSDLEWVEATWAPAPGSTSARSRTAS